MKTFKLAMLTLSLALVFFTSCTNDQAVIEDQQTTEESQSVTDALLQLRAQFDDSGNVTQSDNPAGNIVLDFCFDFVYPLTLSYNNGTTVAVENLNGLVEIMIASTDDLYINGIAFPFNVETYNDATNTIEIGTINNEVEFITLLESCEFNVVDPCVYTEEYSPVCVEITDPDGNTFIVTYSNASYAACNGFTEDDFVENCENDSNPSGNDCFTFNFPLSITDSDTTIVVNSEEELNTVLYDIYNFEFIYPFTITLNNAIGEIVTINSQEDLDAILSDCYGCICPAVFNPVCVEIELANGEFEIVTYGNACEAECEGYNIADFVDCEDTNPNECEECADTVYDPVCVTFLDDNGETTTIDFINACYALCNGYTEDQFVDCENTNPSDCSEQEVATYLQECTWLLNTSLYDALVAEYLQFNEDGSLTSSNVGGDVVGGWIINGNPTSNEVSITFEYPSNPISAYNWTVTQCSVDYFLLESGNEFITLHRDCD